MFGSTGEKLNLAVVIKSIGDTTGIKQTEASMAGLKTQTTGLSASLSSAATGFALLGAGLVASQYAAGAKKFYSLSQTMRQIAFETNRTKDEMGEWYAQLDRLKDLTLASSYTDADLAKAMEVIAAEGRGAAGTADIVEASMGVAATTGQDLTEVVKSLENAMSEWGLASSDATTLAAKMIAAFHATGTSLDMIEQGLGKAAGTFKIFGVGMDEGISLIATLSDVTGQSSRAITGLMSGIMQLSDVSTMGGQIFQQQFGMSLMDMIASGKSLLDILTMIGNLPPDVLTRMLPSAQAASAVKQVAENSQELSATIAATQAATSTGTAARLGEIQKSFPAVKTLEQLQRDYYNFQLTLGKRVFEKLDALLPSIEKGMGVFTSYQELTKGEGLGATFLRSTGPGGLFTIGELIGKAWNPFGAQVGFEGLVQGPKALYVEPGMSEYVSIDPNRQGGGSPVNISINYPTLLNRQSIDTLVGHISAELRRRGV